MKIYDINDNDTGLVLPETEIIALPVEEGKELEESDESIENNVDLSLPAREINDIESPGMPEEELPSAETESVIENIYIEEINEESIDEPVIETEEGPEELSRNDFKLAKDIWASLLKKKKAQ